MKMRSVLLKEVMPFLVVGILIVTHVQDITAQNLLHISTRVHLQEREVTVTVYYDEGEEAWAQHLFDVTVEALPILEELAGFPYPHGFDVEIYPKSEEEMSFFGGENLSGRGIWINRDTFTPETMKDLYVADTVIHESAHYWSDDLIYGKPWMKEGFCELLTYLTYQEMGREKDALHVKNEWSRTFTVYKIYNHPLDTFEYPEYGPGDEKTSLAYGKSALFCYEIYENCGLERIKKINEYLYQNHISADSFTYMNLLEEYSGEDQKEFFMEWIFPEKVDLEKWQKAENAIHQLEELTDGSLSYIEEKWGFHKVMDFVEFQIHVSTQINVAQSYMKEYDFEKALQIITEEIEEVNKMMSEFDGYAEQYFEAEEYYKSLNVVGEICEDKLIAAKERLLCFKYDDTEILYHSIPHRCPGTACVWPVRLVVSVSFQCITHASTAFFMTAAEIRTVFAGPIQDCRWGRVCKF